MNGAIVLLDDAIDLRQAQSSTLTRRLGGEERFEQVGQVLRRNAGAVVAHRQAHPRARGQVGQRRRLARRQRQRRQAEGEMTAVGHGVAGVEGQVHQHLLQLGGVAMHYRLGQVVAHREADIFRQGPFQQFDHCARQREQVERGASQGRAPTEIENLADEVGGVIGLLANHAQVVPGAVGQFLHFTEQFSVEHDRAHDSVEVVRDAGGHLADAGESLLRFAIALALALVGHVVDDQHPGGWFGRVADRPRDHLKGAIMGFFSENRLAGGFTPGAARLRLQQFRQRKVAQVGDNVADLGAGENCQVTAGGGIRQDYAALRIEQQHAFGHGVHDLLHPPRLSLRLFPQAQAFERGGCLAGHGREQTFVVRAE